MDEFAWTKKQAVLYNDIFFVGLAVIAILTFLTVKFITKVCHGGWLNVPGHLAPHTYISHVQC